MKKVMMFAALAAVVGMVAGCFTSATAFTKKTAKDGTVTESKVKIIGTGDKASQIAAEGLFADGASDDLGAGVKTASASQQSTGIRETLEGMGVLLTGIGSLVARTQGVPVAAAVAGLTDTAPEALADAGDIEYSADGYGGVPGANGVGVYGKPSCSRCRAYVAAHPDAQIIDVRVAANKAALWAALKSRGYSGASVGLPVVVTEAGYTAAAK
jgi:uncharacterized protein YneF (UPF0154 family)